MVHVEPCQADLQLVTLTDLGDSPLRIKKMARLQCFFLWILLWILLIVQLSKFCMLRVRLGHSPRVVGAPPDLRATAPSRPSHCGTVCAMRARHRTHHLHQRTRAAQWVWQRRTTGGGPERIYSSKGSARRAGSVAHGFTAVGAAVRRATTGAAAPLRSAPLDDL